MIGRYIIVSVGRYIIVSVRRYIIVSVGRYIIISVGRYIIIRLDVESRALHDVLPHDDALNTMWTPHLSIIIRDKADAAGH